MRSLFFGAALSLAVLGCGQKGPLYLRDNPPPGVKPPVREYKPVPYPKDAPKDAPNPAPNAVPQGPERNSALGN
jgi:predicted small lipoprotein YifL